MNTIADLISEHHFFEGLERADLEFLAGCGRNVHFTSGERILAEGDPANTFFILRTGRVALGFFQPGHGNVIVDTLDGGEVLGWSWLFEPTSGTSTPTPSSRCRRSPLMRPASAPSATVTPASAID
jgi:CRP-like cAMP-binding protein